MNIAICDDKTSEIRNLKRLLDDYSRLRQASFTVTCFQSGEALLLFIAENHGFDIIFLDIFMGPANGILVARKIREFDKKCSIIFATNSRDYAIEGYGVSALQYLLKPIVPDLFAAAFDQAIEIQKMNVPIFIDIKTRQANFRIKLEDMLFAESDARIITLHLRDHDEIRFYERLDAFETQCKDVRFLRCHQSFLVNLEYVHSIGNNSIVLENGLKIPVSISISRVKNVFASYTAGKI